MTIHKLFTIVFSVFMCLGCGQATESPNMYSPDTSNKKSDCGISEDTTINKEDSSTSDTSSDSGGTSDTTADTDTTEQDTGLTHDEKLKKCESLENNASKYEQEQKEKWRMEDYPVKSDRWIDVKVRVDNLQSEIEEHGFDNYIDRMQAECFAHDYGEPYYPNAKGNTLIAKKWTEALEKCPLTIEEDRDGPRGTIALNKKTWTAYLKEKKFIRDTCEIYKPHGWTP